MKNESKDLIAKDLFKQELENKISSVFDKDQVKGIIEATTKYFGINNTSNGKEFWKENILNAAKDYPNTSMRFFQCLTELKSRLGRVFDETIEYQKMEIEREQLEIELDEMIKESKKLFRKTTRKDELNIELKKQELLKKKVRCAFAKDSLGHLEKDIQTFHELCDEYKATGEVKPFEVARLQEMHEKKQMLFLAHALGSKKELTPSELAFFMQEDGTIRPPEGVESELKRLGRPDLASQAEETRKCIDNAKKLRIEGKTPDLLAYKIVGGKDDDIIVVPGGAVDGRQENPVP